ncbi:twin-arginine translocation pathway signal [Pseudoduganella sp. FT26W]|uniref:Twin-arginine translocation pathway signal n=2 Tax=Duganella aquatilis TaxID=2666082 RepID=A0A844CVR0_9BURK|nr:twin-arginine translocation pathway signal [Duganella aquatilis]
MFVLSPLRRVAAGAVVLLCTSAQAAPSVIEGKDGWLFAGWESADKIDRATLANNVKLLQEAQSMLAAQHIGLLVMVVPSKAPLYPQRLPAGATLSADMAHRYDEVLAQLEKAGVPSFDDRAVLQAVEGSAVEGGDGAKASAFYRSDYHWTAWSAEASAAAVAKLIASRWPLAPSSSPGTTLGAWTTDRHYGDLAENFMSPEDRKRIGRESYTVRTTPEPVGGLLDGAPPQVVVVGNSFVQPYLGFPQKLSNALGRPVGLTWNPGNISPWKTLLDAVSTPGFAQHKPKLVVWQFNEARMETALDSTAAWDAGSAMSPAAWRGKLNAALKQ